jgi:uncharacterized protein
LLNLTSLGSDAGVSRVTASGRLSILWASYIVALLQPHLENFSRRLVKTPRLYFLDRGLMCALLGLRRAADLRVHPLRGAVFESSVVAECAGCLWGEPKRGKRWPRMPSEARKPTSR